FKYLSNLENKHHPTITAVTNKRRIGAVPPAIKAVDRVPIALAAKLAPLAAVPKTAASFAEEAIVPTLARNPPTVPARTAAFLSPNIAIVFINQAPNAVEATPPPQTSIFNAS